MRPLKEDREIKIPISFDIVNKINVSGSKWFKILVMVAVWVFVSVIVMYKSMGMMFYVFPIFSFMVLLYIIRFWVLKEKYFMKKREELLENDYMFTHDLLWGIYDIRNSFPHIVYYKNGVKGVFIAFEKGITIGKGEDSMYYHHEAIAEAYRYMLENGVNGVHIDYMDTVGKDERLDWLIDKANKTQNPDLRKLMVYCYDFMQSQMDNLYTSYDVYCFYSKEDERELMYKIKNIVNYFLQANYTKAVILDKDKIGDLVKSVFNLEDFSVVKSTDMIFRNMNKVKEFLKVIWVEKDGERTVLNKTLEELEELSRVRETEKKLARKSLLLKLRRKKKEEDDIDLLS